MAADGSSTLTVASQATTAPGVYPLTVTAAAGSLSHAIQVSLTVSGGTTWKTSIVGSTGEENNSVILGDGHNDGVDRLYVGTVSRGHIMEFTWNGTSWASPVDIGGSVITSASDRNMHNMGFGPGRNDSLNRLYGCSTDGNLYELSYSGGWTQTTVGTPVGECTHAAVGTARNDGTNRLYASRGPWIFEYTWNVDRWDQLAVGSVVAGLAHGIFIGPGRADGQNNIYVASTASGSYEARFSAGAWTMTRLGDNGDIANLSVGIGRTDGIPRVYTAVRITGQIREFTWNGTGWTTTLSASVPAGEWLIHANVADGRGDGVNRVYASGSAGNLFEFTWNGASWDALTLSGGGSSYMYGFFFGNGRNDGKTRLYASSFNHNVYEYSF